ncbi:shikimate kinase [Salmonella enterica subsp. enterica]|uniref:Shikimate kinase n=1 Tax=Salmonella enterica I TaxID=59201 RepID=A0A447MX14_SALET|nr:shikimate kinase [Salmonella enterica subsp. enterica]
MMQPLYLVGPRGCGKTTIGMALAQATGFRFADTDRWLQSHVQMSVADIVEKEGWGRVPRPGNRGPGGGKRAFDCRGDGRRYYSHGV